MALARSSFAAVQQHSRCSLACRPARQAPRPHRALRVHATAAPEDKPAPVPAPALKEVQQGWSKFLQRYEHPMLSSGVGAAVVTTWCMAHGQSPGTAATITVVATITALVLNEVLFSEDGGCN